MKVIIAGGREYNVKLVQALWLDKLHAAHNFTAVLSGGATGVDAYGERWAANRGIAVERFPADWNTHGRAAGPIRNAQMAEQADAVVLFPGGRGAASMKREAEKRGLKIWIAPEEAK